MSSTFGRPLPGRRPAPFRFMALTTGAVVAVTLGWAMMGHRDPVDPARAGAVPVKVRDLRFADQPDGGVRITDARTGEEILLLPPGSEGFVRGAMRGMTRERRREGTGADAPFRLAAWPDHRMTLEDTATGRVVEMTAFGRTNTEAFLRLFHNEER